MSSAQLATGIASGSVSPEKKQEKHIAPEIKNGKVVFKQKPISFEKNSETLQEIVAFRGMLEDRISNQQPPLTAIPNEHKPLIAKLAHESDKTLSALVKHVHQELMPTVDDDDDQSSVTAVASLPLVVVEDAIKSIATRNNYGLDAPIGVKLPAAVCIWRWEVRSEYLGWLPRNSREKAEARMAERVQARDELRKTFEALSQDERDAIIDPKKTTNKLPPKELNRPETTPNPDTKPEDKSSPESAKKLGKKKEDTENDQTETARGPVRPKKPQDPEKTAKEKERLDKKNARLEKEKKEKDAKNKSQSIMATFFSKPKVSSAAVKDKQPVVVAGPSKVQSDFDRTFKPFLLGKDKCLAPQNWFQADKKRRSRVTATTRTSKEIVVIDSGDESDIVMVDPQPSEAHLATLTPQERLTQSLSCLPPSFSPARRRPNPPGFKIYYPESVRDLVTRLSEAEVSGNAELVRETLDKLADRDAIPANAFCFHTDARPGYFGTWTRSSKIIGPRRPLAKDTLVFDYAYDSGEEWEVEEMGEDVADDQDDDGDAGSDRDSDMDSWLVDDDDPVDLDELGRQVTPPFIDLTSPPKMPHAKRKAEDAEKKSKKKRRVDPLIPIVKGPIYETTIGELDYAKFDPFEPYAIHRFNDTPLSINPFTFVSQFNGPPTAEDRKVPTRDGVYVLPALPSRLAPSHSNPNTLSSPIPKKAPIVPKQPFPEAHLGSLLQKISQLQTTSVTALVEAIYHELREHKVKKNAIEAKIREVAEKCKEKKVWVVKPGLMQIPIA